MQSQVSLLSDSNAKEKTKPFSDCSKYLDQYHSVSEERMEFPKWKMVFETLLPCESRSISQDDPDSALPLCLLACFRPVHSQDLLYIR